MDQSFKMFYLSIHTFIIDRGQFSILDPKSVQDINKI
jgi:hypothetical protein